MVSKNRQPRRPGAGGSGLPTNSTRVPPACGPEDGVRDSSTTSLNLNRSAVSQKSCRLSATSAVTNPGGWGGVRHARTSLPSASVCAELVSFQRHWNTRKQTEEKTHLLEWRAGRLCSALSWSQGFQKERCLKLKYPEGGRVLLAIQADLQ